MAIALRRASLFGRAPMIHDLTVAFTLWGYLGEAPAELTSVRKERFAAVAQHAPLRGAPDRSSTACPTTCSG